jgi:hypothetical protein
MVARVSLVLALVTISAVSSEASGQWVADLRPQVSPAFGPIDAESDPAFVFEQQTPDRGSFVGVTVVSAIFAGLGAVGGAYLGAGMGPDGDEALVWAIRGAVVGAWAGAGLGGTAMSRLPRRAFLGSALGVLPGFAILQDADDGRGALLGLMVHGMVTALVTQAGS